MENLPFGLGGPDLIWLVVCVGPTVALPIAAYHGLVRLWVRSWRSTPLLRLFCWVLGVTVYGMCVALVLREKLPLGQTPFAVEPLRSAGIVAVWLLAAIVLYLVFFFGIAKSQRPGDED